MPQQGADLVGAGFPTSFPLTAILGGGGNLVQGNTPARSNLEWFGMPTVIATNTLQATGVAGIVAVPVTPGLVVSQVNVPITATAASVPTHAWAALYAGTGSAPALITQGTDSTSTAIAASTVWTPKFATPVVISSANAPYGFIYVALSTTATTTPTCVSVLTPTTAAYGTWTWSATGPIQFSMTAGSSLAGAAAATIASATIATFTPVVWLT